jgi:hypothetical protein
MDIAAGLKSPFKKAERSSRHKLDYLQGGDNCASWQNMKNRLSWISPSPQQLEIQQKPEELVRSMKCQGLHTCACLDLG